MHIPTLAQEHNKSSCSLQVISCALMISRFQIFVFSVNCTIFHSQVMTFDNVVVMVSCMNV
jgi:predicted YcjX-like family ATPase